jgi:hypothetical protein
MSNPLALKAALSALWLIVGGGVLAILLGRWGHRLARVPLRQVVIAAIGPARRVPLVFGKMFERVDGTLRQWPAAGFSLMMAAIMFGAAMLMGR